MKTIVIQPGMSVNAELYRKSFAARVQFMMIMGGAVFQHLSYELPASVQHSKDIGGNINNRHSQTTSALPDTEPYAA